MRRPEFIDVLRGVVKKKGYFDICCKDAIGICPLNDLSVPVAIIGTLNEYVCTNFNNLEFDSYFQNIINIVKKDVLNKERVNYELFTGKIMYGNPQKKIGVDYVYAYQIIDNQSRCVIVFDYLMKRENSENIIEADINHENRNIDSAIAKKINQLEESNNGLKYQIKEYEKIEKKLLIKQNKLDTIIRTTSDGYSFLDAKSRFIEVNDALCKIYGRTREELIGVTPTEFIDEKYREFVKNQFEKRMEGTQTSYEVEIVWKDGTRIPILVSGTPFYDEYGDVIGSFSLIKEISNMKEMENALLEAKLEAEQLSRYKSDFMANMSHEIRTPMNAIIGMTQLCLNSTLTKKQRSYLEKVNMASGTLLRMINDMLDFAKIESGMLSIDRIEFNASRLFDNVSSLIFYRAKEKGIFFDINIDPQIPKVLIGDPLRFEQILINLANNAIKFTHNGTIIINLKLIRKVENLIDLELSIKDTGIGISEEKLPHIFDAFVQTDKSITRKYGGTGLGLTITKQLVNLMNGSIRVDSEVGRGTNFIVNLPFEVPTKESNRGEIKEDSELFGLKVLLLDENEISMEYVSQILESFTFIVTQARNKEEGLKAINSSGKNYDFMVVVQGVATTLCEEFISRVRKKKEFKNLKMILISSHSIDYLTQFKETGLIDGFMMKPINASILYESILDVFSNHHKNWYDQVSIIQRIRLINVSILIVEDNAFNQIVAKDILNSIGAVVEIAENGAIAIDMVKKKNYDLVLMDVQMPFMDGYEATRRIRELVINLNSNIKIIALTANALKGDREKCINAGMNDYLAKPITPETLINKVVEWLVPEKYALSKVENFDSGYTSTSEVNVEGNVSFLDKDGIMAALENLRMALDNGKISRIKDIIDRLSRVGNIDKDIISKIDSLTVLIKDYDFDEAAEFIIMMMETMKEDDYE